MRRGYTLTETVAALVIVGILAGIAAPRMAQLRDAIAVDHAARQITGAYQRARIMAVMQNRSIVLEVGADWIVLRPRGATTQLWREAGPARAGVAFAGPPRQTTFSPVGLATGVSNTTYTVSRGAARRQVVVSRLGRVRITS